MVQNFAFLSFSVSIYRLCVILLRINHQTLSIGFRSGEYGGKNINSRWSWCSCRNGFNLRAWWYRTLSSTRMTFFPLYARITFFRCFLKVRLFPLSEKETTICPESGLTVPNPVCLSRFLCLHCTLGCFPFIDHRYETVAVLLKLNSSSNKTTVCSGFSIRFF